MTKGAAISPKTSANMKTLFPHFLSLALFLGASASEAANVTRSGSALTYQGHTVNLYGATMYPTWTTGGQTLHASAWSNAGFTAYIDQIIPLAIKANFNTVRVTDFLSGVSAGNWSNATVWANVDYLMQQAHARGLWVILDLSTYRNYLINNNLYAYNSANWTSFINFVGQRYANNSAVAYYAIAGEVNAISSDQSDNSSPHSTAELTTFYDTVSRQLHSADGGNHLISTGGLLQLNWNSGIDWQSIFSLTDIDVPAIHVYSSGDATVTVPNVSSYAASIHKPWFIEEFGEQQSNGDSARAQFFNDRSALARQYGSVGAVFWNFGPEVKSTSFDVNQSTPLALAAIVSNGFTFGVHYFETENLTVAQNSGDTHRVITGSGFSGGEGTILDANAVGDYVTYLVPNLGSGSYDVRVGIKKINTRGIWQLTVGAAGNPSTTNVGAPCDEYSSSEVYTEIDFGSWSPASTGDKWYHFTITGKNAASTGYGEAFDYIKLVPQ